MTALTDADSNVIHLAPKKAKAIPRQIIWPTGQQALDYIDNYDRMKAALEKIAAQPLDDDDEDYPDDDGNKRYVRIHERDIYDYYNKAITAARNALRGK